MTQTKEACNAPGIGDSTTTSAQRPFVVAPEGQADALSPSTVQPQLRYAELFVRPRKILRQLLGLNPFKTSYFTLYTCLDDVQSRLILALGVILALAAGVPLPLIGVIFGKIIDSFPPPEQELRTRIGQLLGVAAAYFVITWGWAVCWGVVGERVSRRLREKIVRKAVGMDLAFFEVGAPDMSSMLTGDTEIIQMGTSEKVGLFIQSISYFVAAFLVGFVLDAKLAGILFAAVIPAMTIAVCTGSTVVSKLSKKAAECSEKASNVAEGAIHAVQVVQAFNAISILSDDHCRILDSTVRQGIRKACAGALLLGTVFFIAYAANALAFWQGSQLIASNSFEGGAGTVYAVVFLILDASFVVGSFGPFIQTFSLAAAAGSKIFKLLEQPEPAINVYSRTAQPLKSQQFNQDICFRDVSFVYPARPDVPVLEKVNMVIKPGTTNGIVGLSGSGKSTIASLLMRFYDPTSGTVTLGEQDIRKFDTASLRSHIALVDQDPVLFSGTILDNVKYGIPDWQSMSEDDIAHRCSQAVDDANADFVRTLPKGTRTLVGGAGSSQLSGGQRQRICLARALVAKPSLLVLDEPTSALDATSEALILQSLNRTAKSGCTLVVIAHRLATIRDAENIVVMGNGKLLEEGTHDQLMQKKGSYRRLVEAQSIQESRARNIFDADVDPSAHQSDINDATKINRKTKKRERSKSRPRSLKRVFSKNPDEDRSTKVTMMEQAENGWADASTGPSLGHALKRCLMLSRPEWLLICCGIVASTTSGSIVVGEAIVFGNLIEILNETENPAVLKQQAGFFCLMFFVLSLIALLAHSTSSAAFGIVSERLIQRTRDISLRTILRQDLAWFSKPNHSPAALMTSLNTDTSSLAGLSGVIIGTLFSICASMIGGIVLAHAVAWKIAIVLLAAVPIMLVAGFVRLRVLAKSEQRHSTAYSEAATLASEACRSIRTVAALGRETHVCEQYTQALEKPYSESLRFVVLGDLMLAFSLAITYFVYALAYWWGSKQVRQGNYTERQFFIVLPALLFSAQACGQMFSLSPEMARAKSAAKRVFALHDQKPSIATAPIAAPQLVSEDVEKDSFASSTSKLAKAGSVELRAVSLEYPSRPDMTALQNVNTTIDPGSFIALVGPSGAGKSSMVNLLERFYDPTTGAVLVDGMDIRDVGVEAHRARISLVSQEPHLFPGSIFFNIALGRKPGQKVNMADVEGICKACGIHGFITGLPDGYNTECGQNGSQLSGGQKQRVAIARALIRNPDILLLDEATSALDSQSEQEVQEAIKAASTNRTTIAVAHRLSSVYKADRIYVLDKGRVVEEGKHDELVALGGIYAAMYQAQVL